jgi:DnaJ family protein C protein 28
MSPIDWKDLVERRIQQAQTGGQFDNLPGKGKPLDLRENPFAKPEWRLAHRMLKNAGFTLDWIELDTTIRVELAQCQKLLEDQLTWANKHLSSTDDKDDIDTQLEDIYRWTVANYIERAKKLNGKIELFNLMVPLIHLQKPKVQIDEELLKFQRSWPQGTRDPSESSSIPPPCPTVDAPRGEE